MAETNSYNLFRRKQEPALCCAVRQDQPVPPFIETAAWNFGGTIATDGSAPHPRGFKPTAAEKSVRLNGFYVFHSLQD